MSAFGAPSMQSGYGSANRQQQLQAQGQVSDPYGNQVRQAMGGGRRRARPNQFAQAPQATPAASSPQQSGGYAAYSPQAAQSPGAAQPIPPPSQGNPYQAPQAAPAPAELGEDYWGANNIDFARRSGLTLPTSLLSYDTLRSEFEQALLANARAKNLSEEDVRRVVDTRLGLHDAHSYNILQYKRHQPRSAGEAAYQGKLNQFLSGIDRLRAETETLEASNRQRQDMLQSDPRKYFEDTYGASWASSVAQQAHRIGRGEGPQDPVLKAAILKVNEAVQREGWPLSPGRAVG